MLSADQALELATDAVRRATRGGADAADSVVSSSSSLQVSVRLGTLENASRSENTELGLRAFVGTRSASASTSDLSPRAIEALAERIVAMASAAPEDPYAALAPAELLASRVAQVSVSLSGTWSVVEIVRADGFVATDIRPLVRLSVSIVAQQGDRREAGSFGTGGRYLYDRLFEPAVWNRAIDEALAQAIVNLDSVAAPAGETAVLLAPGWPGIILHEAIGHGLEGDFNRKGTSAFSGRIGERVAAAGVTVIDDGSIPDRRGSLPIDDEGTPTSETILIEDGILKGYMQDRLNARLMGAEPTGNGRRESFAHAPMPRMTNTFMRAGNDDPAELLSRIKTGIFAKNFGGGQVDITSGKFVFSCTEAYKIENGKLGAPIKGATLIGDGPSVLTRVTGIGNDFALDEGVGMCGKGGQGVPAGVGQPTLLVDRLTVGGTAA